MGCDPHDRTTWTRPVVRVTPENDWRGDQPLSFRDAANTQVLHEAFDKLVGIGQWKPRPNVGMFVVRFPSSEDPGDLGWHIDASIAPESEKGEERHHPGRDYSAWRVNLVSQGRALLMLFLFSDVTDDDAPTRIRVGSHRDVVRLLAPYGEQAVVPPSMARVGADRPVVSAVGEVGSVYLCHPFLVHAARPHRGRNPRFMSQPPLEPAMGFQLSRDDGIYCPVEQAIRSALAANRQ
jgi:hypothetical protein